MNPRNILEYYNEIKLRTSFIYQEISVNYPIPIKTFDINTFVKYLNNKRLTNLTISKNEGISYSSTTLFNGLTSLNIEQLMTKIDYTNIYKDPIMIYLFFKYDLVY